MHLHFIPYQETDFAYCNALIESNMSEYFESAGIQWDQNRYVKEIKNGIVRIVYLGKEKVGFVHLSEKGMNGYVNTIQLSPEYRSRGFGSKMMEWIEEECKRRSKTAIQLSVFKNSPAIRLYERLEYMVEEDRGTKYLMKKEI